MYLFYTFEQIKEFAIFSSIDFSVFSSFEVAIFTVITNIFYLLFLSFVIKIIYKSVNRILNFIF